MYIVKMFPYQELREKKYRGFPILCLLCVPAPPGRRAVAPRVQVVGGERVRQLAQVHHL